MSDMQTISAVRYEITELRGKSAREAYDYFVQYLDKDDLDYDYDPEADYLYYNDDTYRIVRCWDTNRWGLEYILYDGDSYTDDAILSVSIKRIEELLNLITKKLQTVPRSEYVTIVCTTWYNGVDEPIKFNKES